MKMLCGLVILSPKAVCFYIKSVEQIRVIQAAIAFLNPGHSTFDEVA